MPFVRPIGDIRHGHRHLREQRHLLIVEQHPALVENIRAKVGTQRRDGLSDLVHPSSFPCHTPNRHGEAYRPAMPLSDQNFASKLMPT